MIFRALPLSTLYFFSRMTGLRQKIGQNWAIVKKSYVIHADVILILINLSGAFYHIYMIIPQYSDYNR